LASARHADAPTLNLERYNPATLITFSPATVIPLIGAAGLQADGRLLIQLVAVSFRVCGWSFAEKLRLMCGPLISISLRDKRQTGQSASLNSA